MRKENNGECREKNEKLCKVKRAGESDHYIEKLLNIIIFHDGLFNRKNWRLAIKLNFENLNIFFFKKRTYTHAWTPPPLPLFTFVPPPPVNLILWIFYINNEL